MLIKLISTFLISIWAAYNLRAQEFTVSGYADTYIAYDNDRNGNSLRQFSAVAPVRDEFRINLAQITGKYSSEKIRGIVSLQFGDIPKYNWPQAPNEYLQFIQEANAGFMPAKNLWIDFGYFLTHVGAEGVIPVNSYLSSLALISFYEPFFQSGIKASYNFSDKFSGSIFFLNGYNVFADNNKNKSAGLQLDYKPLTNLEIIYNNIFGNEQPSGSKGKTRFLNNVVVKWSAPRKFDLLFGGDFAFQTDSKLTDSSASADLFGALLTLRYHFSPEFYAMIRGETYIDEDGILSGVFIGRDNQLSGLRANGITLGVEHRPVVNAYIRLETRYISTMDDLRIFSNGSGRRNFRSEYIFTTGIYF